MAHGKTLTILLKILVAIGVVALTAIIGVWLAHALMMGGMWLGWLIGGSRLAAVGCSVAGLLILAALVAGARLLLRRRRTLL